MSGSQLNLKAVEKIISDTNKRMDKTDETMRLVIVIVLFMLGAIVITTSLWVVQSFLTMKKPEIIYNINVPVDNIEPTIDKLSNIKK